MKDCFFRAIGVAVVGLCMAGCSASGPDSAWQRQRQAARDRQREVIYNNDGNEPVLWPTNQPFSVDYFLNMRTAAVADSRVDTIYYTPISSGFGFLTADIPSADLKTRPVGGVQHLAAYTNMLSAFLALGTDPVREIGTWCRAHQKEFFISLRVNDTHDMQADQTRLGPPYDRSNWAFSPFKAQHPHMLMGSYTNKPPHGNWSAVDFTHQAVRERFFQIGRELCENYDLDGLDLDFFRHPQLFRSVAWGGTASDTERALLTDVMRRLRTAAEAAGQRRGRPILLSIRVPDSVDYCHDIGIDLEAWLREGLVDLVTGAGYWQCNPWTYLVELCHRYRVKCYASLDESRLPPTQGAPTAFNRKSVATYRGQAMAARQAGLDGVMYFNLFSAKDIQQKMWGSPKAMRLHDKNYPVTYRGNQRMAIRYCPNGSRHCTLPELSTLNPAALRPGGTATFPLWIGDDLAALRQEGIVPVCELAVDVAVPPGLTLRVTLNGQALAGNKSTNNFRVYSVRPEQLTVGENRLVFEAVGSAEAGQAKVRDAVLTLRGMGAVKSDR